MFKSRWRAVNVACVCAAARKGRECKRCTCKSTQWEKNHYCSSGSGDKAQTWRYTISLTSHPVDHFTEVSHLCDVIWAKPALSYGVIKWQLPLRLSISHFSSLQCSFLPKFSIHIETKYEDNKGSNDNVSKFQDDFSCKQSLTIPLSAPVFLCVLHHFTSNIFTDAVQSVLVRTQTHWINVIFCNQFCKMMLPIFFSDIITVVTNSFYLSVVSDMFPLKC